ncbi:MAG: GIN domain-containing protein [Cyclobacteriaceae bacterium]
MKLSLNLIPLLLFCLLPQLLFAQQSFEQMLPSFSKVFISDKIDLHLVEGKEEAAWVSYENVDKDDIRLEVRGKKLRVYLKDCRRGCKPHSYPNGRVKLHLTYRNLEKLVVKGQQQVSHEGQLNQEAFVLKTYGDSKVMIDDIQSNLFKASLFGDGHLQAGKGSVSEMIIKSYGDQEVSLSQLSADFTKVKVFGDSYVDVQVREKLHLMVLGALNLRCSGSPSLRRFVLGELTADLEGTDQDTSTWGVFFLW